MVKLQFSKVKKDYLHGKNTYFTDRISLHFPKHAHRLLLSLKGRQLSIDVSKKDKTIYITLTELDKDFLRLNNPANKS